MGEDSKFCSNCKKSVSGTNFTVHTVHCHKNIVTCSICHEPVVKTQYQQHVESAHSSIPCKNCNIRVEAANLFYHQKELCPKRLVACKYCELEVKADALDSHLELCGARTDRCKGCTKYVQSKNLQFHYEHDHRYLSLEEKETAEANGQGGDEGEECPVCLGPITLPLTLQCGHVFCMICVKGIASTTKNCAICRRDIQRDMLMDIRFCGEADIIKNYVNNPKYKKTTRSKSVPRVGVTTQDYDDMVSALLSSRTSTSSCRYQRPNNGHTPPSYTPYCYALSSTTYTTSQSSPRSATSYSKDDDSICSSAYESSRTTSLTSNTCRSAPPRPNSPISLHSPLTSFIASYTPTIPTVSPLTLSPATARRSASVNPSSSIEHQRRTRETSSSTLSQQSATSSIPPSGSRPRRPTSLALQSSDNAEASDAEQSELQHLSQEEHDRWLAFQIAKDEDQKSLTETSKTSRAPFRRSRSMPESDDPSENESHQDNTGINTETNERKNESLLRNDIYSRLPPTSPRCNSTSGSSSSPPSNRRSNLTKSSSDSNASEGVTSSNPSLNTGARPKSSTGLKKRVSFKEDSPPLRRQAPVLLPCEFCDEMFSERDLMRHQTSCDQNETKNPREYLLARRTSGTSPLTSPTSPISPTVPSTNSTLVSPSRPPPASSPLSRNTESPARAVSYSRGLKTPPHSPSLHQRPPISPMSPPQSPSTPTSPQFNTASSESCDSALGSRHTSISPCPVSSGTSTSGVSSGTSSTSSSSVSTTPSSSSSASPVPTTAPVDTPTENETDFSEDIPFARPRKGKLISSAIDSWRSIGGLTTPSPRPRYARSNTAPLHDFQDESNFATRESTSHSANIFQDQKSQNDELPPRQPERPPQSDRTRESKITVFKRNRNKYRAPPPPISATTQDKKESENSRKIGAIENDTNSHSAKHELSVNKKDKQVSTISEKKESTSQKASRGEKSSTNGNVFKFDSKTIMNSPSQQVVNDVIPCEFCKKVFPPEKFRDHQAVCEADSENESPAYSTNHSTRAVSCEEESNIPSRTTTGQKTSKLSAEDETNRRKPVERSSSVRESSSSISSRSREFETTGSRLERTSSIKETSSRYSRATCDSPPRRWMSREGVYSSNLDLSAAYSGGASLTSSTTSLNNYSGGKGWSSHISMIRDEMRSLRPSSLGGATSTLFGTSRYRDRSVNRHRPSSLYSSRTAFKLIADAFQGPKDKGRYLR